MNEQKSREWISFRVKPDEYNKIHNYFSQTTCRKLSGYARNVLLQKPVIIKYRNQSADSFLEEMIGLKKELNAIGNNYNQAVRKLHTLDHLSEVSAWLKLNSLTHELFFQKTTEILEKLNQIHQLWSSE